MGYYFARTAKIRVRYWYLITEFVIFMSLFLNFMTIIDLQRMLYNPFKNANSEKVANDAFWLSFFLSLTIAFINLHLTESFATAINNTENKYNSADFVFAGVSLINIIGSIIVMFMVSSRLNKPGMTTNLKQQIKARYFEYIIVFVFLSVPINIIFRPEYRWVPTASVFQAGTKYVKGIWIFVCSFGILMALSRLRDPLIRDKFQRIWTAMKCQAKPKEDAKETIRNANLNAFLKTSLSTELVISILKGITILAASSSDKEENIQDSDMLQVEQMVIIKIKKFRIKDSDNFDVQKA